MSSGKRSPAAFTFRGEPHQHFFHCGISGNTRENERCVELPLALSALNRARGLVLEIGVRLPPYGRAGHTIVDRYAPGGGVITVDAAEFRPPERFDLVISISTLQHVGWGRDGDDPDRIERLLKRMRRDWLLPGGHFLATVPLGYNPHLDRLIRQGRVGTQVDFLRRISAEGEWEEVDAARIGEPRYGEPFPRGNVLAVLSL